MISECTFDHYFKPLPLSTSMGLFIEISSQRRAGSIHLDYKLTPQGIFYTTSTEGKGCW